MIVCSIDVTLIEKSRLKEVTRGSGVVAKFLELVLIETPEGKYGDYMVVQGVSKEERAAGTKGKILGNGKIFMKPGWPTSSETPPTPASDGDDDVPF